MKNVIEYIQRPEATKTDLGIGKNLLPECAFESMYVVKGLFHKVKERQYIHFIISPEEKRLPIALIKEIAREIIAWKKFVEYQVVATVHGDKAHTHIHMIVNTVNFNNGNKYQQTQRELQLFKEYVKKILSGYGLNDDVVIEEIYDDDIDDEEAYFDENDSLTYDIDYEELGKFPRGNTEDEVEDCEVFDESQDDNSRFILWNGDVKKTKTLSFIKWNEPKKTYLNGKERNSGTDGTFINWNIKNVVKEFSVNENVRNSGTSFIKWKGRDVYE